ncbi:hypothetical protein MTO96_024652 [Rhipicephalus appendiculatus]
MSDEQPSSGTSGANGQQAYGSGDRIPQLGRGVFPPAVASPCAVVRPPTNSVGPAVGRGPLPVATWIALGRARMLHANSQASGAMAAQPDVLLDASHLPLPWQQAQAGFTGGQ